MLRHPAVAGRFYKDSPDALKKQVQEFIIPVAEPKRALGILSPHAGLMYSGSVAGAVYSNIVLPDVFVLIGPNHTGLGAPVSLMAKGSWETPFGTVQIDEPLAASILSKSSRISEDSLAHMREHSLEVQLPFIQYFKKDFTIVPIQMMDTRLDTCLEVGRSVAESIAECKSAICNPQSEIPGVLIVASSDMSHYERAASAKDKDFKAIQHILALDPEGLHRTVKNYGITMCGFGPTVAMIAACKLLGATKAKLIKYTNSGEASGDYEQVVGYAGVVIV
jgi:MEMO1 family protein